MTDLKPGSEAMLDGCAYVRLEAIIERCALVRVAGEETVEVHVVGLDRLEPLDAHVRRRGAEILASWSGRSVDYEMSLLREKEARLHEVAREVQEAIRSSGLV